MRALIDQSTISASLRATGQIPSSDRELFQLDLVALRNLVDTILLADEIGIIRNYKEEYSKEREQWLAHSSIRFHDIDPALEKKLEKESIAHTVNMRLQQNLAQGLAEPLDSIGILFRHAWRNSESFLLLKTLGASPDSNQAIFSALRSSVAPENIQEIRKLTPKAYNKSTKRIAQALAWLMQRTVYYRQLGKLYGYEYIPHPIRSFWNLKCILFDNHPFTRKMKLKKGEQVPQDNLDLWHSGDRGYYRHLNQFMENFWNECNSFDDNIFGVQTYEAEIPPFLSWLTKMNENSSKTIIERAFEMREDDAIRKLRSKLTDIYLAESSEWKTRLVRDWHNELRSLRAYLQKYLGYMSERVTLSAKLLSYQITVPRVALKPYYPFQPHLALIRDIILEMANIGSLGRTYDLLWREKTRRSG